MKIIYEDHLYEYVKIDDEITRITIEAKDWIIYKAKLGENFSDVFTIYPNDNIKKNITKIESKLLSSEENIWNVSGEILNEDIPVITITIINIHKVHDIYKFTDVLLEKLEHEIIHLINVKSKIIKKYVSPGEGLDEYITQPLELDSQIAPIAKRVGEYYTSSKISANEIYTKFGLKSEEISIEKTIEEMMLNNPTFALKIGIFKKYPKIWKKFLKEIYKYV